MTRIGLIRIWSLAVGAMDALTGLLLVIMPAQVLGWLHIPPLPAESWVWMRWIGIFVLGVGLSYLMALGSRARGEAVWIFTAGIRCLVAGFVCIEVGCGDLAWAWIAVALSDATVAAIQIAILRAGWWREVPA